MKELQRWNRVHKLTAIIEDEQIVVRHFLDSVSLSLCFEREGIRVFEKSMCDVGSGAGFPGVPLQIYYQNRLKLTLVESVAKKCAFLEHIKTLLGLDYRVLCKRAEDVKESFDVVFCRALGSFEDIVPLLESLSREYVFVMKGKEPLEGYRHCRIDLVDIKESYVVLLQKTR